LSLSNVSINGWGNKPKSFWGLLSYGKNLKLEQCRISNSTFGIEINSINNSIENCDIFSNSCGVYLNSKKGTISNSNINNCGNGIRMAGENNEVIDTYLSKNFQGIYIDSGGFNLINGSTISNSTMQGIYSISGFNNTIINCNFSNNGYEGIYLNRAGLLDPPRYYKIYNNEFHLNGLNENSTGQAYDRGGPGSVWDNGYPSGGNYWDDYSGNDIYSGENQDIIGSDGLGDIPYKIPGNKHSDRYPLMYPIRLINSIKTPFLHDIPSPDPDGNFTLLWTSVLNASNYTVYEEHEGITNLT
jgi:parallel beta-helix repeat protein